MSAASSQQLFWVKMVDDPSPNLPCKLLRCALKIIDRIESTDAVRIIKSAETSCTAERNDNASAANAALTLSRKEKKRRKLEQCRQQWKESTIIRTQVLTGTSLIDNATSFSNAILSPSSSDDGNAKLEIPQSVRSTIHVKPLIILDINGILCHRIRTSQSSSSASDRTPKQLSYRPAVARVANTDVVPRSDLLQFLLLLQNYFCLAVWTSATRKTAKQLVKLLFPPEISQHLLFVWHRNFCNLVDTTSREASDDSQEKKRIERSNAKMESTSNSNESSKGTKRRMKPSHEDVIAIKSLAKVWDSFPLWDSTNTLLIDDSPEKTPKKYRTNSLHPTPISGTTTSNEGNVYVDNDEENQNSQRYFFELLAKEWTVSSPSDYLSSFLKQNAREYNMGWCQNKKNAS